MEKGASVEKVNVSLVAQMYPVVLVNAAKMDHA